MRKNTYNYNCKVIKGEERKLSHSEVMVLIMKRMTKQMLTVFLAMCMLASCAAKPDPVETAAEGTGAVSTENKNDINISQPAIPEPLEMTKYFGQQTEWDEEILLAFSEYSGADLSDAEKAEYPALSSVLAETRNMLVRSMEDEYDNLLADAKDDQAFLGADSFVTKESVVDEQIRRADSVAVSLLTESFLVYGNIYGRYMNGTTYDTETGKQLKISDVIADMSDIPAIVKKELQSHMWNGYFSSDTAVEDYFRDTSEDGIRWTLDYNGVTFYFAGGDVAEYTEGPLVATVTFAEYPELFHEKYMAAPEAYIVELPLEYSFLTDLDGDGTSEELYIVPFSEETGYEAIGIYTDTDTNYYYTEFPALTMYRTGGYNPYYVKTADGRHYLYIFADGNELASHDMKLRVIDITGGEFREVGDMYAAPGYIPVDCSYALTDPDNMMLENFETQQEAVLYCIGSDGMPVLK